ncbi:MAG: hypothetical protein JKX72_03845 [Robiginitomaculum sp.]|nr:hypothetical protein [Robiginitomaculum sp.]
MFDASNPRDNEPFFTLLGRDPAAPHIIRAWAYKRCGQDGLAQIEASKANAITEPVFAQNSGEEQIRSAFTLADEMETYRRNYNRRQRAG